MADRINQNGEKLFTVRPRNSSAVTQTRGNVSSIRFILPKNTDKSKWSETVDVKYKTAFEQAVSSDGFINFIAKNVSYDIQEKSQTIHTFGGQEAVYFYGKAPVQVNFSGLLVDDLDNDQFTKFLNLYMNYLRGTKASQDYCYIELVLSNAIFTGAFTGIQIQQESSRDTDITFNAQFLAKTFTLASTDTFFTENGRLNQTVPLFREPDPTIKQEDITNAINQNANAGLSLGEYTRSFGTLPTVTDLIGFSASDITDFFGYINDFLNNVTKPVQDLANRIDDFANDAIGLLEAVERGTGTIINNVESASRSVYGAIDSMDDAVTTICNFPESMSNKLGSIGSKGGAPAPAIAGSDSIASDDAMLSLSTARLAGSARGTPDGDAAVIAVTSSRNTENTTLSPTLSSSSSSTPTLSSSTVTSSEDEVSILRIGG